MKESVTTGNWLWWLIVIGDGITVAVTNDLSGAGASAAVYRYDLATHRLLAYQELAGRVGTAVQQPTDGSIWLVVDGAVARLDPTTLALGARVPLPKTEEGISHLAWRGGDLYAAAGPQLLRLTVSTPAP